MPVHHPVMPVEVLAALNIEGAGQGVLFVDATLGLGGHTELILQASPTARVIGFDRDAEAIALATERLSGFGERFEAVNCDYRQIKEVIREKGIESVVGVLADLQIYVAFEVGGWVDFINVNASGRGDILFPQNCAGLFVQRGEPRL